ncbi:MAG: glycosyltransferase [Gammaproteobacteria bacterium]|nr:glycosyltransferase [Gammaproteobacteria bacterium]
MPVHDTPVAWLREAVESVLAQRYDNFELCICDDASTSRETVDYLASLSHPRVRMARLAEGGHIAAATNRALELAGGDYVAFMDHDDRLDPDALFHVCEAINETQADVVYTDEDYLDVQGRRCRPNFKPDFSPDLLLSHNYVTHLLVVRRELLEQIGGLDSAYDGCRTTTSCFGCRRLPKASSTCRGCSITGASPTPRAASTRHPSRTSENGPASSRLIP